MRVRDPERGCWLPFLPDGSFELAHPDDRIQCALLEVDMGTLTVRRFARKVQAFEVALARDVFSKHFTWDEFEVFVLTPSRRRLEALRRTAEGVVRADRQTDYFFATLEALQPARFAEGEWCDLGGELYEACCTARRPRPARRPPKPADGADGARGASLDGLIADDGQRQCWAMIRSGLDARPLDRRGRPGPAPRPPRAGTGSARPGAVDRH
jgi:hypothetical protein